jgi:hypothetical protein
VRSLSWGEGGLLISFQILRTHLEKCERGERILLARPVETDLEKLCEGVNIISKLLAAKS